MSIHISEATNICSFGNLSDDAKLNAIKSLIEHDETIIRNRIKKYKYLSKTNIHILVNSDHIRGLNRDLRNIKKWNDIGYFTILAESNLCEFTEDGEYIYYINPS